MSVPEDWFLLNQSNQDSPQFIIEQAFQEAKKVFESSKHLEKNKPVLYGANSLYDVLAVVEKASDKYSNNTPSKTRVWLQKFSQRVGHYGHILDVLVQHHPQYVALAWGAMKLLFLAIIEHENTSVSLARALCEIGDLLPRTHLAVELYSTPRMSEALARLYVCIMRLLARAHSWFQASKLGSLKRAAQSVMSPFELRYGDLLESVRYYTGLIEKLSVAGNQAEVRHLRLTVEEIHENVMKLGTEVTHIQSTMTLNSAALVSTNNRLTDLQLGQIIQSLPDDVLWTPAKAIQYLSSLRRRQGNGLHALSPNFYTSGKLRSWTSSVTSELCIVMGTVQSRFALRGLCVDMVEQLRLARIPYLLALKVNQLTDEALQPCSAIDVLRFLVKQAFQITAGVQTERSMAVSCTQTSCAVTKEDWLSILGAVLSGLERPIYIIIDLETLHGDSSQDDRFSWLSGFRKMFADLQARGSLTKVKVMLLNYGVYLGFTISEEDQSRFCLHARTETTTVRFGRFRRHVKPGRISLRLS